MSTQRLVSAMLQTLAPSQRRCLGSLPGLLSQVTERRAHRRMAHRTGEQADWDGRRGTLCIRADARNSRQQQDADPW